jgi:hypothetical protein
MMERPITWETLDWSALERMRDTFLAGKSTGAGYWTSHNDLANYDFTFAQRIGWKWDAVLRELRSRGWTPPQGPMIDWGCGSGIAGRRVAGFFGENIFGRLRVFDRSSLATAFAVDAARAEFPSLRVEPCAHPMPSDGRAPGGEVPTREFTATTHESEHLIPVRRGATRSSTHEAAESQFGALPVGTLVISHVVNELDETGGRALRQLIDRAEAVLWVEPGTYSDSHSLIAIRESLRETFKVIAPCTHQTGCGLRTQENERHWCHHFAAPPAGIMADSNWVRFAQRIGIDLRSLPYSFLVMERKGPRDPIPGLLPDGWSRIIGEPRFYKGYAKIFSCQTDGVRDVMLQKRDAREFFAMMKHGDQQGYHRWSLIDDRIIRAD